jgi:3-phosphoshikimate 1-carboxyvinyltransferase
MEKTISSPRRLAGTIAVPPDKSISHRTAIFNAVAEGEATVEDFLTAADCLSTLNCLRELGVKCSLHQTSHAAGVLSITGHGFDGLRQSADVLDAGNSGTTFRLLSGLLAGRPFLSTITGDESLRRRPMGRIIEPLRQMGAHVYGRDGDTLPPLVIHGGPLKGIDYQSPVSSAQVKSAVLLAGLQAEGETVYEEPVRSRDHTERMLRAMGIDLKEQGNVLRLSPPEHPLAPLNLQIPGDFSAAAFWLVAAVLHPNATLTLKDVDYNPTRRGLVDVLNQMGADIAVRADRMIGGEPVVDLTARSSRLRGVEVEGAKVVTLIDEVPVLAVAASVAEDQTVIRDAGELRLKESDRLALTALELGRMGAQIREEADTLVIEGTHRLTGAAVESHGDHRLAIIAEGETVVQNAEATDISYPGFWKTLESIQGMSWEEA